MIINNMPENTKKVIELDGVVKECLPDTKFVVEVDVNGVKYELQGYLSGKMRMNYIRILEGDKVKLQVSPYDPKIGRIVYRYK